MKTKSHRPLHKRVLLHPFSIMVLLCAGVIIAATTFRGHAETYDVTATVPATAPNVAAIINNPYAGQHFNIGSAVVSGSCPDNSYVKLYRNAAFSGVAQCVNGYFQIQTDLAVGANQLQAKVFNVTNQEGPASGVITVFYDYVTPQPVVPPSPPANLQVTNVGNNSYSQGSVRQVGTVPTLSGFAPPFADVVVIIHSDPVVCKTRADASGWWACTLDRALPAGLHQVEVLAVAPDGTHLKFPTFQISVVSGLSDLRKPLTKPQLVINSEYKYQTHFPGEPFSWTLGLSGGKPPYNLVVDWGDGSKSEITRQSGAEFTLTHAYPASKAYTIMVSGTDANGTAASLQLSAMVKGYAPAAATQKQGTLDEFLGHLKRYLWVVWPAYIVVAFMVSSYWLGEREMYRHFMEKRRLARQSAGKGPKL